MTAQFTLNLTGTIHRSPTATRPEPAGRRRVERRAEDLDELRELQPCLNHFNRLMAIDNRRKWEHVL